MERLSNSYMDLHNELKIELSSFMLDVNEECIVIYSVIPWFAGGQYSLSLVQNIETGIYRLIEKTWNNDYDLQRFSTGVFNLERLCIRTRDIVIPAYMQKECRQLIANITDPPATLESKEGIVLDGVEYELTITTTAVNKKYQWKWATDDIAYFDGLLTLMKYIAQVELLLHCFLYYSSHLEYGIKRLHPLGTAFTVSNTMTRSIIQVW